MLGLQAGTAVPDSHLSAEGSKNSSYTYMGTLLPLAPEATGKLIYRNLNILNKLRNKENDVQKMVKRNSEHLSPYSTLNMQENTIYSESFLEQSRQEFKHRVC